MRSLVPSIKVTTTKTEAKVTVDETQAVIAVTNNPVEVTLGTSGPQGATGPQGPQGIQGEKGDKGDKGDPGQGLSNLVITSPLTGGTITTAGTVGIDQTLLSIGAAQVEGTAVIRTDNLLSVNGTAIPFGGTVITPADFITAVSSPITNVGGTAGLDQSALQISPAQVTGTAVITTDSRLSDARTPTAHAITHELGGTDELELSPAQVSGTAVIRTDNLFTFNGTAVPFGGTATTPADYITAVNAPLTNTGGTAGLDQTQLSISPSQVAGTAVVRSDNLLSVNGTAVPFGGSVTTPADFITAVASPITNTNGTAGLDQTLLNIASTQVTGTAVVRSDNLLTVNGTAIPFGGSVVTPPDFITAVSSPITNTGGTAGLDQTALSIQPSQVVGTAVITTDARLSDARTPTAHAISHESGGSDEIEIAPAQVSGTAVITTDPRLSDTRTTTNALTLGDGLSGTSFNGSTAVTAAVDSTIPRLTASQTFTGAQSLVSSGTAVVPLTVTGAASQSADYLQVKTSGGSIAAKLTSSTQPRLNLGTTDLSSTLGVMVHASGGVGQIIRGAASQTANLQEWQNSAGSILTRVGSAGNIDGAALQLSSGTFILGTDASGGRLTLVKATSTPANPGANLAKIYFRDGTNAGTLKLVVRAGAAGAETTILDNIPQ